MAKEVPVLEISGLTAGYDGKVVIEDVGLMLNSGEIVAVIGHNGAGKSTLLKAIIGFLPLWAGEVKVEGVSMADCSPLVMLRKGIAVVPQGGRVFGRLSVRENLDLAVYPVKGVRESSWRKEMLELFPDIQSRLDVPAGTLSGGQRQVLSVICGLAVAPRVLLLDEPSAGLAPERTSHLFSLLQDVTQKHGCAVLIVEQRVREVIRLAGKVCVLRRGRISFWGSSAQLGVPEKLRDVFL